MIYLDASYIVKCYLRETGTAEVLALVHSNLGCSSAAHARTEVWSGIHRRICDKTVSLADARNVWRQFEHDDALGVWHWLSLTENVIKRACSVLETLPADVYLRSSDALHLPVRRKIGSAKFTAGIESYSPLQRTSDSTGLMSIEFS